MATTSSTLSVNRPRFGRPERTEIRANFARDVLPSHTRVEPPRIAARIGKELGTIQSAAQGDQLGHGSKPKQGRPRRPRPAYLKGLRE